MPRKFWLLLRSRWGSEMFPITTTTTHLDNIIFGASTISPCEVFWRQPAPLLKLRARHRQQEDMALLTRRCWHGITKPER